MKLYLNEQYKSLEPFFAELPEFAILTGLNGAGKTQILTALKEGIATIQSEQFESLTPVKFVNSQTLFPNESEAVTRESLNAYKQSQWEEYQQNIGRAAGRIGGGLAAVLGYNPRLEKTVAEIARRSGNSWEKLTVEDFHRYLSFNDLVPPTEIFFHNFSNIFKDYYDKAEENEYAEFRNQKRNQKHISYLTQDEFVKTFGPPPWETINKAMKMGNLDYYFNFPENSPRDAPFQLKLRSRISDVEIRVSELSSGEKVIMSLGLALYNSKVMEFPKVLLMDEPDAFLHPSMTKHFLNVIQKVFIKEKRVKVIMTTHSPSTVALATEENLFAVSKGVRGIEKITKDAALSVLMKGVPSLSVNYENRRQIFVESENDNKFYSLLYEVVSKHLHPEISLSFISSGQSKLNSNGGRIATCNQVIHITELLRKHGNASVWGIVDYDKGENTPKSKYVKILGGGNRYSIENYLFDPILVAALLLREKILTRKELGLTDSETFVDFKNLSSERLQYTIDVVLNMLGSPPETSDFSIRKCKLISGIEVEIPNWYLHYQGHSLENALVARFVKLGEIKRNKEDALKLVIIEKVIDELPDLISIDLLKVFEEIQK